MKTPNWLIAIRRHDFVRGLGRGIERKSKRLLLNTLRRFVQATPPQDPAKMEAVQKILILRPNYRIGNTLSSTPLIGALRNRFPSARLDYLGADTTSILLKNLPLDNVILMSRSMILRPWSYVGRLWSLHRENYDLVVAVGNGSFSDMICMKVLNARYRMGSGKWAKFVCNILVVSIDWSHAYEVPLAMARVLGVDCRDKPCYAVSQDEKDKALFRLSEVGLSDGRTAVPFLALFVGGHHNKRWPLKCWEDLVRKLGSDCPQARILVFLGPEESSMGQAMKNNPLFKDIRIIDPLPLRDFAALLQQASLVVAPDTGPMHLAVAVDVPVIAIMKSKRSLPYAPRGESDVTLLNPTIEKVCESVCTHSTWPAICSEKDKDSPCIEKGSKQGSGLAL